MSDCGCMCHIGSAGCDQAATAPASETPGPGEGDPRGEVAPGCQTCSVSSRLRIERDAAVEQRTLAEQKVARALELRAEHQRGLTYGMQDACMCLGCHMGRALADPEADR